MGSDVSTVVIELTTGTSQNPVYFGDVLRGTVRINAPQRNVAIQRVYASKRVYMFLSLCICVCVYVACVCMRVCGVCCCVCLI